MLFRSRTASTGLQGCSIAPYPMLCASSAFVRRGGPLRKCVVFTQRKGELEFCSTEARTCSAYAKSVTSTPIFLSATVIMKSGRSDTSIELGIKPSDCKRRFKSTSSFARSLSFFVSMAFRGSIVSLRRKFKGHSASVINGSPIEAGVTDQFQQLFAPRSLQTGKGPSKWLRVDPSSLAELWRVED